MLVDFSVPDSIFLLLQPLRRRIYAVLGSPEENLQITEFLPVGTDFRKFQVEPSYAIKLPTVAELYNGSLDFQLATLSTITECNFNKLNINLWPITVALRLLLCSTIDTKITIYEWQVDAMIVLFLHCSLNKKGEVFKKFEYNSSTHINCEIRAAYLASLYQVALVRENHRFNA